MLLYHYVINVHSVTIQGEHPYIILKFALAVILAIAVMLA